MLYPREDSNAAQAGLPFSCAVRIGLAFVAQSACLSFAAVVSLLTYVAYNAFRHRGTRRWHFLHSHLDIYLLGLLLSDLIQSIGSIMDIRWIVMDRIVEDHYCTAQAVLQQFGEVGVALCSMTIAIYTFADIVLRWREPRSFTLPLLVLGVYVVFLTLIVGLGYATHRGEDYFGDAGYWCWIGRDFDDKQGIGLEYIWLWAAAFINLILYVPVFLTLKRVITVEGRGLNCRIRRTTPEERQIASEVDPRRMLFYPAVAIVTVLPIGVVRFDKKNTPYSAFLFAGALFYASGLFNVVVYTVTRPGLLRPSASTTDAPTGRIFWSDQSDSRVPSGSGASRPKPDRPLLANSTFDMDDIPQTPHASSGRVYQDRTQVDQPPHSRLYEP